MAGPATGFTFPSIISAMAGVPTGLTAVTIATVRLCAMYFNNTTTGDITVTVTDTAGVEYVSSMIIPANMAIPLEFPFLRMVGIKWIASGAGLNGQVEGY